MKVNLLFNQHESINDDKKRSILRWMNMHYCGRPILPENEIPSNEHVDAHHLLSMMRQIQVEVDVQLDGSFIPTSISMSGKKFKVVEK